MDLKQQYNEVAEKQRYFFDLISQQFEKFELECDKDRINKNLSIADYATIKEFKHQEFEQNRFNLSGQDFLDMKKTKELAESILIELKLSGIEITAKEIINGFEEVN